MSSRLVFSLFLVALSVFLVWAFRPPQGNAGDVLAMPHVAEQGQMINPDCGLG